MPEGVLLLVRVPVYGLCDSGRGFWKRLRRDAKSVGFHPSMVFQAFYFLKAPLNENKVEGESGKEKTPQKTIAVLTTHVDDLLYSFLPEGKRYMDELLSRFDVGTQETGTFRYCGKQVTTSPTGITIDVRDNSRKIKPIKLDPDRQNIDPLKPHEVSQLRSVVGSLSWIARQARPDILFMVSRLQSEVKGATVQTAKEANRVVDLTLAGMESITLNFPYGLLEWDTMGILSVSDASFANETGMKSQQGRCHFLTPSTQLKRPDDGEFTVYPLSFSSTTIKRVCRATLQCEAYSLQNSMETGDRFRALLVEMRGLITEDMKGWEEIAREHCPQLSLSDCMSLVKHLNSDMLSKCQDKRLEIEMRSMRQSLRDEDDRETYLKYPKGGDKLLWIHTSSMIADCFTKKMKPDLLLRVLRDNMYKVDYQQRERR